jgi:Recombinase-like helix-turn-helix domain
MPDYNPWISHHPDRGGNKGGPASVEVPAQSENVSWQTRPALPTDYENALADALTAIFAAGVEQLPEIVERLNRAGPKPPDGGDWTAERFVAEMGRLGI